jgi:hypothetical protein
VYGPDSVAAEEERASRGRGQRRRRGGGNFGSLIASPRRKTRPDLANFGSPVQPQNIYHEAFVRAGRDGAAGTVALVGAAPD